MNDDEKLFRANDDIAFIAIQLKSIGWMSFNRRSLQRIIYLSKVLYTFAYENDEGNVFDDYDFSVSPYGPQSSLIERSIVFLKSFQFLGLDSSGFLRVVGNFPEDHISVEKKKWIKTIVFILGKYGEERIFGFVVHDPVYNDAVLLNQQTTLDASLENRTVQFLNNFKSVFEETLEHTSSISKAEYLDLYFEYIFGKIITQ